MELVTIQTNEFETRVASYHTTPQPRRRSIATIKLPHYQNQLKREQHVGWRTLHFHFTPKHLLDRKCWHFKFDRLSLGFCSAMTMNAHILTLFESGLANLYIAADGNVVFWILDLNGSLITSRLSYGTREAKEYQTRGWCSLMVQLTKSHVMFVRYNSSSLSNKLLPRELLDL